jgi:hypothetical protein
MKKGIIIITILIHSLAIYAHNAQISTAVLVQGKDHKWHLIVSASLSAFQYELKNTDPSLKLDSLDAKLLQKLIVNHLREKIKIKANEAEDAIFTNGNVILAHQTDVNFEVIGIPEKLQSINFKHLGFATLRDHHCILKIICLDNQQGSFVLQQDNQYAVSLKLSNHAFIQSEENIGLNWGKTLVISLFTLLIGLLFYVKFLKI